MHRVSAFMISFAIAFAVVVFVLVSCVRTPTAQPTQASSPTPTATVTKKDDVRVVIFEKPRLKFFISEWLPTEVINVTEVEKGPRKGDWIIEVRNVSDRPIKSVEMDFSPPYDCKEFVMSPGWLVGLGADNPYLTRPARPTLDPGETDKIVVKRENLNEDTPARKIKRCPPDESYCYLSLEEVNYADGTKWKKRRDPDDPNWTDR